MIIHPLQKILWDARYCVTIATLELENMLRKGNFDIFHLKRNNFWYNNIILCAHIYNLFGPVSTVLNTDCISWRGVRFSHPRGALSMTLNSIRWWGFNSGNPWSSEYPFIAITPRFTFLNRSILTHRCDPFRVKLMGQIDLFEIIYIQ